MITEMEIRSLGLTQYRTERLIRLRSMADGGDLTPAQRREAAITFNVKPDMIFRDLCLLRGTPRWHQRDHALVATENSRAKAMGLTGTLSVQEWLSVCSTYQGACAYCGLTVPLSMDHIVPLSRGGAHSLSNIQPLCRSCNSKKRDKLYDVRDNLDQETRIALRELVTLTQEHESDLLARLITEELARQKLVQNSS